MCSLAHSAVRVASPFSSRAAPRISTLRRAARTDTASAAELLKDELLAVLGKGGDGAARMARVGDRARLEELVVALEARSYNCLRESTTATCA